MHGAKTVRRLWGRGRAVGAERTLCCAVLCGEAVPAGLGCHAWWALGEGEESRERHVVWWAVGCEVAEI